MEHKEKLTREALFYINAAYLLADMADSFVMDAEETLSKIGKGVKYGELKKFKAARNVAAQLRQMTKKLSAPIYGLQEADAACEDSDFLKECFTLIAARTPDDDAAKKRVIRKIKEATL